MASTANPIRDFKMTATGGWAVEKNDFVPIRGTDAPPQAIAIGLRTFLGECMLDSSKGVDWLGQILIKNPNPIVVEELLRQEIESKPDVTDALSAGIDGPDSERVASVAFQAKTIYSDTPLIDQVDVETP